MELIDDLVKKLGVSPEQAKGGASLIFNLAKEKLDVNDFSTLTSKIPVINSLLGDKKETEETEEKEEGGLMDSLGGMFGGGDSKEEDKEEGGLMDSLGGMFGGGDSKEEDKKDGGLMDSLGGMLSSDAASGVLGSLGLDKLSSVAKLSSGFSKLGLDADMITKFVPVVLNFAKTKGGSTVTDLLAKVLK